MQMLRLRHVLESADGELLLFAFRAVDLERVAWREGRDRALRRERAAAVAFAELCARTLHERHIWEHEPASDVFLAAMPAPQHDLPRTARAVSAELVRSMSEVTGLEIEGGWTLCEPGDCSDAAMRTAIEAALERGRRERERFAFFAAVGHEMRTPLMSIDGYLQTVLECDLDEPTRRHFIEVAQSESLRLRRLVESMYGLSLADLDAGLEGNVSCDAQNAVERAADAIFPAAARRGTRLRIRSRVRCAIPLAAEHAVALFVNLLENAVKHGRERGRIDIYLEEREDLTLYFDDDGPGVPDSERAYIFEALARGRAIVPGDGLGLAIVRATVEHAGGHVAVTASPLGGARFIVRLPIVAAAEFHSDITMRSP